jgi:Kef-type K+ transport system membrane component KefB
VRLLWPGHPVEAVVASVIFGITASISSPMIVALVSQRLPSRGPLTNTARIAGALSALFPLLAFGVLFMVVHSGFYTFGGLGSGLLWWLFVNIFGIVMGFIMVLFTHERTSDDEMLLLITGTVLLIGGVCYFLELPSLYTSMIMGFVVGNFARRRDQIFRELHVIEKTLFVAFLIMVGAMVAPPSVSTALVVATYVVLRLALKYFVTGRSAMKRFPGLRSHGPRVGLVMSAQGVMAMAVALDFELAAPVFDGIRPLSVVCYAVIINDVIGYALTRRVLVAAGEARSTPQRRQGTP